MLRVLFISILFDLFPDANGEEFQQIRDIEYQNLSIREFTDYLNDDSIEVKIETIRSLGRMQSPSSRSQFKKLLQDPDPNLQAVVIEAIALNPYVNDLKVELLQKELPVSQKVMLLHSLGHYGKRSHVDILIEYLNKPQSFGHHAETMSAVFAIGLLAQKGVAFPQETAALLLMHSKSIFSDMRRACAFSLSQLNDQEWTPNVQEEILKRSHSDPDPQTRVWLLKLSNDWKIPPMVREEWQRESHPQVQSILIQFGHLSYEEHLNSSNPHLQRKALQALIAQESSPWPLVEPFILRGSTIEAYENHLIGKGKDYVLAIEILTLLVENQKEWPAEQYRSEQYPLAIQSIATKTLSLKEELIKCIQTATHTEVRVAAMQRYQELELKSEEMRAFLSNKDINIALLAARWFAENPSTASEEALWIELGKNRNNRLNVQLLESISVLEEKNSSRLTKNQVKKNLEPWLKDETAAIRRPAQKIANLRKLEYPNIFGDPNWVIVEGYQNIQQAVLTTVYGEVVIDLFPDIAPLTVSNFVRLAEDGYYNNLQFHRVLSGFVVQTGQRGFEDPGWSIPDELNMIQVNRGAVGMALNGKDSAGSQFFITTTTQPHLQATYPIFGQVKQGQWIVERLQPWDKILSVEIERRISP